MAQDVTNNAIMGDLAQEIGMKALQSSIFCTHRSNNINNNLIRGVRHRPTITFTRYSCYKKTKHIRCALKNTDCHIAIK